MAPRKYQMRIIRQDAGFWAKLGFGGMAAGSAVAENPNSVPPASIGAELVPQLEAQAFVAIAPSSAFERDPDEQRLDAQTGSRKEERDPRALLRLATRSEEVAIGSAPRGQVVYVAVSLTTRQACLAQAWATAGRCTVQFLIRLVAQGLRDQVFDDWERAGMPDIDEPRGARGKHPTSVTLTLRPQFAAELSARHDPLGMVGLARVMGPAFRARFETAFDEALSKLKLQSGNEGDEK
ncbi:hypothetical protein [Albidovulum sp.]|uniref:hypothetical protein n=1 Tax=Albidovulum sp. TaxID=1872424 RepID=UPI0039B88975